MRTPRNYLALLALSMIGLSAGAATAEPRGAAERTRPAMRQSETVRRLPTDLMGTSLRRPEPPARELPFFVPRDDSWMFRDSDNNNG